MSFDQIHITNKTQIVLPLIDAFSNHKLQMDLSMYITKDLISKFKLVIPSYAFAIRSASS